MNQAKRSYRVASLFLVGGLLVVPFKHADAQIQVYVEEPSPPPDLEEYPHVVYEGEPVYYVHGRWYYRHGPRWVYYREPPPRLREQHEHEMMEAERVHDARVTERSHGRHDEHRAERAHEAHDEHRADRAHEAEHAHEVREADRAHDVRQADRAREARPAPPAAPARTPERGHEAREERKPEAARPREQQHARPDAHDRHEAPPAH